MCLVSWCYIDKPWYSIRLWKRRGSWDALKKSKRETNGNCFGDSAAWVASIAAIVGLSRYFGDPLIANTSREIDRIKIGRRFVPMNDLSWFVSFNNNNNNLHNCDSILKYWTFFNALCTNGDETFESFENKGRKRISSTDQSPARWSVALFVNNTWAALARVTRPLPIWRFDQLPSERCDSQNQRGSSAAVCRSG